MSHKRNRERLLPTLESPRPDEMLLADQMIAMAEKEVVSPKSPGNTAPKLTPLQRFQLKFDTGREIRQIIKRSVTGVADIKEVLRLSRSYAPDAIEVMAELMHNSPVDSVRLAAAMAICDRAMGKPTQSVELSGNEGTPLIPSISISIGGRDGRTVAGEVIQELSPKVDSKGEIGGEVVPAKAFPVTPRVPWHKRDLTKIALEGIADNEGDDSDVECSEA